MAHSVTMPNDTSQNTPPSSTPASTPTSKAQAKRNKMHMTDTLHAVVRLLPSNGLEGAFRVHVLPESLETAQLKVGDLCEISSVDGASGASGCGIAWRADDRMGNRPKNRPAKMTETIRSAFGFEEGSTVAISQTKSKIYRADKIVLCDITPRDYDKSEDVDNGCWRTRVMYLFANCEAIAAGITFDVPGKKKLRKRFFIENIESKDAPSDLPCLYLYTDNTEVVYAEGLTPNLDRSTSSASRMSRVNGNGNAVSHIVNKTMSNHANGVHSTPSNTIAVLSPRPPPPPPPPRLNTERIGGLVDQCRRLNQNFRRLLDRTANLNRFGGLVPNTPVLIHGYEGTGKTMLLDAIAESGFRKVSRLTRESLTGGSITKNQSIIQDVFQEAAALQPSLILMDDLEALAPTDDVAYGKKIANEIALVQGKKVMIVAATRNPTDVKALLITNCFTDRIELSIPDMSAREQILNILQGKPALVRDSLSSAIASQTHGFTGRDVATLYQCAARHAWNRNNEEIEQESLRTETPPAYEDVNQVDNMMYRSTSSRETGHTPLASPSSPYFASPEITVLDFQSAFLEVAPTALREIFTEKPKICWSNIGGSGAVKNSFDEIIGWQLEHKNILADYRYQPPKGMLLYGPPGCSKTLTAQAVANTYNFNFIAIKGAELISMYVGESERAVREVFRKAKAAAPCVVFFDEIDSIGGDRDGGSGGAKGLNVVTTLLTEMDGFETLKDVFVMAATNKPQSIDPALMRPGRFDRHVYLGPPGQSARVEIFAIATRGVALASDVSLDWLASESEGHSGAEIVRICQNAKEAGIRRHICDSSNAEGARLANEDFAVAMMGVQKGISKGMLKLYEDFARRSEV